MLRPRRTPATGQAFVDVVLDQAEQKGTGRWTVQTALDLGVPITGIAEATFARALSGSRAAARGCARRSCPRTPAAWEVADRDAFVEDVRSALYASKVVAYSQGFDQIAAAQRRVRVGHRPRRDGADLAGRLHHPGPVPGPDHRGLRAATPDLPLLLADPYFTDAVAEGVPAWRRVVAAARSTACRRPAFSSSLAYYDGVRAERLPAT